MEPTPTNLLICGIVISSTLWLMLVVWLTHVHIRRSQAAAKFHYQRGYAHGSATRLPVDDAREKARNQRRAPTDAQRAQYASASAQCKPQPPMEFTR